MENEKRKERKEIARLLKQGVEKVASFYFQKANDCIFEFDFKTAYEYLELGYDYLICDCLLNLRTGTKIATAIKEATFLNCKVHELNFIQAYVGYTMEDIESALIYINLYLKSQEHSEMGYYLKARIYSKMDNHVRAMELYQKAISIKETNKTLYRIGREKEEKGENGLPELYKASIADVTSHCCAHLGAFAEKKGILLPNKNDSFLISSFNKGNISPFFLGYINDSGNFSYEKKEYDIIEERRALENALSLNAEMFLNYSSNHKGIKTLSEDYPKDISEDEYDEEDYDDSSYYEEEPTYNDYNGSYAQDVEGYSDQDIRDVFDGEPDAYWNID